MSLYRVALPATWRGFARRLAFVVASSLCALAGSDTLAQKVTYYHNDPLGSPVVATDATGAVVWKETYRPYGHPYINGSSAAGERLGFAGKPYDRSTGLSYMGARYYDPYIGRFLSIDPKEPDEHDLQSLNRYAYANNNPVRFVDPDGHSPFDIGFLIFDATKLAIAIYEGAGVQTAAIDVALSIVGVAVPAPGVGQALKAAKVVERAAEAGRTAEAGAAFAAKEAVGGLRAAGKKDAHHVIQDAAVRDLPGYNTNAAPGIHLEGPSNVAGTPHSVATGVQRQAGGGTYAAERRIGYKAMRRAGVSDGDARAALRQADDYFGGIGVGPDTVTRIPGNR